MEPIEIVAIVVCAVIVLGVLISAIIRRVKGKTGCDCADCCGGPVRGGLCLKGRNHFTSAALDVIILKRNKTYEDERI